MTRCGIIGFGKMGRIRADSIEASGLGKVVGIYEPTEVAESSFPTVASEEEILSNPEIDAIFICTPNHRIPELCMRGLRAGKHVFSEKPPAFNEVQLKEVMDVEREVGDRVLMYGFNHRQHDSIQRMKEVIDTAEMGKVLWMRGRYGKEVDESFFEGWRADPKLSGGGIFLDQGIHMLDLFLHLGGDFDEAHSFVSNLFWNIPGVEDNVFAIFRNSQTGVCASLHSTMTQWRYLFSLEIFLEGGALVLNGLKTSSGVYGSEDLAIKRNTHDSQSGTYMSEERLIYEVDDSWKKEINAFFGAIQNPDIPRIGNSSEAMKVMRLVDLVYQSKN
ncbi:MAG: oxidoreductase [Opitutae bacterium]|nr:oxidoreductase [Opitutae bacterium]|tara:strand:+ start:86 stop:1078 length:993 start_codon:yes stop_codon:yes gene_type:complete